MRLPDPSVIFRHPGIKNANLIAQIVIYLQSSHQIPFYNSRDIKPQNESFLNLPEQKFSTILRK